MERGFIPSPREMPQDGSLASCAFSFRHPAKLTLDTCSRQVLSASRSLRTRHSVLYTCSAKLLIWSS